MTAIETLQKYGLKTDVKSVRERYLNNDYRDAFPHKGIWPSELEWRNTKDDLRAADLSLLCDLAEKGERYEAIIKRAIDNLDKTRQFNSDADTTYYILKAIIKEAEGESK